MEIKGPWVHLPTKNWLRRCVGSPIKHVIILVTIGLTNPQTLDIHGPASLICVEALVKQG